MSILDNIRFWDQVLQDSRRTLVVPPDMESHAIETMKARGLAHVVTVKVSHALPGNTAYLVDERAIEANLRETLQHHRPTF